MPVARHCKVWARDGQGLAVFSTIGNLNRDPAYLLGVGSREWGVGGKANNFFGPIPHSQFPTPHSRYLSQETRRFMNFRLKLALAPALLVLALNVFAQEREARPQEDPSQQRIRALEERLNFLEQTLA